MSTTKADLIAVLKSFIFGSKGAQLQQKAGTHELLTEDTGLGLGKALREEFDDLYIRSVLKPTAGTNYSAGVGTPFLCELPDGGVIYFLFTGWSTPDGLIRSVFLGEIDGDFKVTVKRILIPATTPANFTSHWSVHAIYDSYNNQWMVFTSSSYTLGGIVACLFRYSSDFSTLISTTAPLMVGGVPLATLDCGVSPLRYGGDRMEIYTISTTRALVRLRTTNLSLDPPVFTRQTLPVMPDMPFRGIAQGMDVLHASYCNGYKVILVERFFKSNVWNIVPIFVEGKFDLPELECGGIASESLLSPYLGSYDIIHTGHPHLSWLPNRKLNLFFATFKAWTPSFKHEIYVCRLPVERLNPKSYQALNFYPWYGETATKEVAILANDMSLPFTGYGRKSISFQSNVTGNLDILYNPDGTDTWLVYDTVYNTNKCALEPITFSAPLMRLRFNQNANVIARVCVEPK